MKVISIDKAPWKGTFEEKEMREAFWHTSSHILAQAVKRLYPKPDVPSVPPRNRDFFMIFLLIFPFYRNIFWLSKKK